MSTIDFSSVNSDIKKEDDEIVNSFDNQNKEVSKTSLFDNQLTQNRFDILNKTNNSKRVRLTTQILRFTILYGPKKIWQKIAIIVTCALFQGFLTILLIQNTGLYNFGISSITQGLARITFVSLTFNSNNGLSPTIVNLIYQLVFWVLYLIINIPLIIFSWLKVGRRFTYLTIIYLVVTNVFGFCLNMIPGIDDIAIFTNVNSSVIKNFLDMTKNLDIDGKHTEIVKDLLEDKNFIKCLSFIPGMWKVPNDANKSIALMCYGMLFALSSAFFYTVLFITDSSTGGTDFISQWYAKRCHKSIASIMAYVNLVTLSIGALLGSYLSGSLVLKKIPDFITVNGYLPKPIEGVNTFKNLAWDLSIYFSPNVISILISLVLFASVTNVWFPKYRLARVEIYTSKTMEIRSMLLNDEHPYSLSIQDIAGGYSLNKRQVVMTISMFMEIPYLIRRIRSIDEKCLISIISLHGIDGYIYLSND